MVSAQRIPDLLRHLVHTRWDVRLWAVNCLAEIGPQAYTAVYALTDRLQDENADVRYRAVQALGEIGPAATDAVPALITVLTQEGNWHAAHALGNIGVGTNEVVQALVQGLKHTQTTVRVWSARALAQLGPAGNEAVPTLTKMLGSHDLDIRDAAQAAIDAMTDP